MTIPEALQLVIQAGALGQGENLYEELLCDTEDNIATEHERIFINNLGAVDQEFLDQHLSKLEKLAEKATGPEIITALINLLNFFLISF